jgi:hypothetical protein
MLREAGIAKVGSAMPTRTAATIESFIETKNKYIRMRRG